MPDCLKCNSHFNNAVVIDGKVRNLQRRKYCLTCSPFGLHNTRAPVENWSKVKICLLCDRIYELGQVKGHSRTLCNSCRINRRRFEIKKRAVSYKGGKCVRCGYSKCIAALNFHHLDAKTKDFSIGSNHSRSWESIRKELDKCILLCANCHAEEHAVSIKRMQFIKVPKVKGRARN